MIVFLVLAFLAAVYFIAPMADRAVQPDPTQPKRKGASGAAVLTPGLVALGRALDQYGRGQPPQKALGRGEEVRKTKQDRV
jgi:Na+-transporting methylmalonyl-CoA/oxaloacetate decarboxylase gamma subunit